MWMHWGGTEQDLVKTLKQMHYHGWKNVIDSWERFSEKFLLHSLWFIGNHWHYLLYY